MKTLKSQCGFSIIELIVVLLVLIILAVTAAPKFLDVSEDALEAQRQTVASNFRASVANVKRMWILAGRPTAANNNNGAQVTLNSNTTVTIDDNYGYPVGSNGRDRVNNFNLADCESVFNDLIDHNLTTARRGQVNNTTFIQYDIIVTRQNGSPDICHYTWSATIESRPSNNAPSAGQGFSYNPTTGVVSTFDFG